MTIDPTTEDPHLWLEEIEGERALAWVTDRSDATLARLREDPRFTQIHEHSRRVFDDPASMTYPRLFGDHVYNFWQDAENPRGIWRRAPRESFVRGEPTWQVLIDLDLLCREDDVNWTWGGSRLLRGSTRAMVALSRGGGDAVVFREFDLDAGAFVDGGFETPESKGNVVWEDESTLLVSIVLEEDDATESGYPRRIRRWRRGTPLDGSSILYEASRDDVLLFPATESVIRNGGTHRYLFAYRLVSILRTQVLLLEGETVTPIDVPLDATVTLHADQLVVRLRSDWTVDGNTFEAGSLLAAPVEPFRQGRREMAVLEEPVQRGCIEAVATTADGIVVQRLRNVESELVVHRRAGAGWVTRVLAEPGGTIDLMPTEGDDPTLFFTRMDFLTPLALHHVERVAESEPVEIKRMPSYFDPTRYEVNRREATSADGESIPYFVVHVRGIPLDGSHPTHLYGYGGFEVSQRPSYLAHDAVGWLEHGGVYVKACIRGGGEFGSRWHRAALREKRQRAFDDFIAVAEDLIEAGYTSPPRLGASGGSNGGVLVGAMLTQRPDLFGAIVAVVPLFDMRRYHKLLAGASWMSEFGNPDDPEDWAFLGEYSPYQNVREGVSYPPVLVITSTRDDRVHPGHARKMVARLEELGQPVQYYENTEGGHAAGATGDQLATNIALKYTFLLHELA